MTIHKQIQPLQNGNVTHFVRSYAWFSHHKASRKSAVEATLKENQCFPGAMRESFSARCSKSGGMGSNRKITELGVSNPRVTGSPPKIFLPRYKPIMPNMGLVEICGQPLTSVFSMADHCFISSEIGGILGRSRIARDCGLADGFRFIFFAF